MGGNSSSFGAVQVENSPHLIRARTVITQGGQYTHDEHVIPNGEWSKNVWSGATTGTFYAMNFIVSSGEVRPRNQAIRIWKRV